MNEQNRQLLGKGRRKWHSWATTLADTHHKCFRSLQPPDPHGDPKKMFCPHFAGEQTKAEKAETFTPPRVSGKRQNQHSNSRGVGFGGRVCTDHPLLRGGGQRRGSSAPELAPRASLSSFRDRAADDAKGKSKGSGERETYPQMLAPSLLTR